MRTLPMVIVGAVALSLTGCSLLDDEPSPSPSGPVLPPPPTTVTSMFDLYGLDAAYRQYEVSEAEYRAHERQVQACMQAAGWEYALPAAFAEPIETPDPDATFSQAAQDAAALESAAETAFFIVLNALERAGVRGAVRYADPNAEYTSRLSSSELDQFMQDLWGVGGCSDAHQDDRSESDQFILLAEGMWSKFQVELGDQNPYGEERYVDGMSDSDGYDVFDPAIDAANTGYRDCLRSLGYDDFYHPYSFERALSSQLTPQVRDAVADAAPVAFTDLPADVRAEIDRLLAIETAAAVETYSCTTAWRDAHGALSLEWQVQYVADHWESIWPDIDLLRQRDDAPAEWAAQWDDYPPATP